MAAHEVRRAAKYSAANVIFLFIVKGLRQNI